MTRTWIAGALLVAELVLVACDEGLTPELFSEPDCAGGFQGICGKVTFRGSVPDSTDVVYIVAYRTFPTSQNDLFTFLPLPPPVLRLDSASRATPQAYSLPLADGTYQWVLAAWKKVGTLSPQNADSLLREAGFYRDPADTTRIGTVVVNGTARGVDFVVDFTSLHPVSYYFPAPRSRP